MTPLPIDEERALVARAQAGDKGAVTTLMERLESGVQCLVSRESRRAWNFRKDLESAAREGALVGIQRHDVSRGTRLATTCEYWVRLYVREELVKEFVRGISTEKLLVGSWFTLHHEWDASAGDVEAFRTAVRKRYSLSGFSSWRAHRVVQLLTRSNRCGESPDVDELPARAPSPEELLEHEEQCRESRKQVHKLVSALDKRQRYIVDQTMMQDRSMADLSTQLGVSREWVRQLRNTAVDAMREVAQEGSCNDD